MGLGDVRLKICAGIKESVRREPASAEFYVALFQLMQESRNAKTRMIGYIAETAVLTGYRVNTLLSTKRSDFGDDQEDQGYVLLTKRESKQHQKEAFQRYVPIRIFEYFLKQDKDFRFNVIKPRSLAKGINVFMKENRIRLPVKMKTFQNKDLRTSFGETCARVTDYYRKRETVKEIFKHKDERVS